MSNKNLPCLSRNDPPQLNYTHQAHSEDEVVKIGQGSLSEVSDMHGETKKKIEGEAHG